MNLEEFKKYIESYTGHFFDRDSLIEVLIANNEGMNWNNVLLGLLIANQETKVIAGSYLLEKMEYMENHKEFEHGFLKAKAHKIFYALGCLTDKLKGCMQDYDNIIGVLLDRIKCFDQIEKTNPKVVKKETYDNDIFEDIEKNVNPICKVCGEAWYQTKSGWECKCTDITRQTLICGKCKLKQSCQHNFDYECKESENHLRGISK